MSNVDHPTHYNKGKFEAIEVIEDWQLGFCLGNTVKYISRCFHKGNPLEDLKKARWYLDRYIQKLESRSNFVAGEDIKENDLVTVPVEVFKANRDIAP